MEAAGVGMETTWSSSFVFHLPKITGKFRPAPQLTSSFARHLLATRQYEPEEPPGAHEAQRNRRAVETLQLALGVWDTSCLPVTKTRVARRACIFPPLVMGVLGALT